MSLPHDHLSPLLLKAERAIKNSHFNCPLSFIICFGLFYLLQHSSHVHTDSMWLTPCETVGSMEMVVSQGLLHWCVLCVQHNDWYIVGIQKVLAGQRDKGMNNSTSRKVYWMNSSVSHTIRQLSFKCRNKEMISYILFLFPQRIECDYFSNINSRFNNIIHMLKREWNFSTNAKIA